jgi:hypothetical protein
MLKLRGTELTLEGAGGGGAQRTGSGGGGGGGGGALVSAWPEVHGRQPDTSWLTVATRALACAAEEGEAAAGWGHADDDRRAHEG